MTEAGSSGSEAGRGTVPTGVKLLLGCLGLVAVGMVLLAIGVGVGGFALKRTVESAFGGLDEHREASEVLRSLEARHPFTVPEDGVVDESRLARFLEATDAAWEELASWATEIDGRSDRVGSDRRTGLRDLVSGAKTLAGGTRGRVVLADALQDAQMSLGEYVWIGLTMERAASVRSGSVDASRSPAANVRLAERYAARIPRLDEPSDPEGDRTNRGAVLAVAVLWGMTEVPTWQALGLDSLRAGVVP